jgi:DnaJ-class molecular chaperone
MIKRLLNIVRAEFNDFASKNKLVDSPLPEPDLFDQHQEDTTLDPLSKCYANLEIPVGSDRETIKYAWKTQMKKYHPDLHSSDPEKKQIAEELTRLLNQAYRTLDKAISKK